MNKLFCKLNNHASSAVQHVRKHKHRYALGTFGSFAIVKMALLFAGFLGISQLVNVFAANTPVTVDMPDGTYLKRVIPKISEVNITDPDQATKLQSWFNQGVLSLTVVKNHQLTFFTVASIDSYAKFNENMNGRIDQGIGIWGGDPQVIIDFNNARNNTSQLLTERDDAAAYITTIISHNGTYTNPYTASSLATTDLSEYQEFFTKYPLLKLGNDNFVLPHLTSWTSHPIDMGMLSDFLDIGYVANLGNITTSSSTPFILASIETYLKRAEAAGSTVSAAGGNANFSPNQQHYLLQYFEELHFDTPLQLQNFMERGFVTNIGVKDDQEVSFGIPGVVLASVETYLKRAEALQIYDNNPIYGLGTDAFATNASGNFTNVFLNAGRNILQLGSVDVTPAGINRILSVGSVVSFGYKYDRTIYPYGIAGVDTYLKLARAIIYNPNVASSSSGVAIASLVDDGLIGISDQQQKYISQYLNNIADERSTHQEIFDRFLDKGFITNIGYRNSQNITFGVPSVIFACVETYLKFADAVGLTRDYRYMNLFYPLGTDTFATDTSGNFTNVLLNAGRNILQLESQTLTREEIDRILTVGNVVSFGYIYNGYTHPYGIASVETYLKLSEALGYKADAAPASAGDGVTIASIVDDGFIGLNLNQQKYIGQYLNNITPNNTSINIDIFDTIMGKGFITNFGVKDNQEVSFGIPGVVMASVENYLKFAEAVGLNAPAAAPASTDNGVNITALNNTLSNNIFSLGNGNFAMDASGNFQNPFLNTSRRILQLGSNISTPEKLNSLLDYGNVVSFGYIIGTHIQPYSFSSVETYLKLAEVIGLTYQAARPASAGDGVAIASLVDQGLIGLSNDQIKYINQYLNIIHPIDTATDLEVRDTLNTQGFVINFGIKDNKEVSFGTPSVVLASVETYLKFAEAIGLTAPAARPASADSGVNIAALNNALGNNIFSLGNGNFAMDASGNVANIFLNAGKKLLKLGDEEAFTTTGSMALFLEKGSVVSFGYIIGTQIQPYSLSSVETYLKFADAVGLTASVNAPASTGDGVDITSLGDNGLIGLSDDQQHYIGKYLGNIIPNGITLAEIWDRIMDKGFVTNIGYKDNQNITLGTPSAVFAGIETYLKRADMVGLTYRDVGDGIMMRRNSTIYPSGTGDFMPDVSGNLQNPFLNAPITILNLNTQGINAETLDRILDKGIVVSHGFQAPDNATLPNGLVSVEIYNKLHEAIFGYDNTPRSLQFMIPLSPDQQQYIRQYINNITSNTLSQAEMIDRTLDKGIITNIGYHNNKDVSIGIPGFVLINVETYLQSIEIGFINPSTIFTLGDNHFSMDGSGTMRQPLLNIPLALVKRAASIGWDSMNILFDYLLSNGIIVSFGAPEGTAISMPVFLGYRLAYLSLADTLGFDIPSLPTSLTHDNPFTLAQAQQLTTQFTRAINTTNYSNFGELISTLLDGIVIDTFADRGSSNTEPTTWDLNIFSDMLDGNYPGLESIGLPLPFINPGTGDDIRLMTPAFYFNNYYNNNSGLLTYNRFTNADLGGTIPIYPQHQIFYAMKTCGDGIQQRPNTNGTNEYCDEGTLNGQAGHCNTSCTAVIAPGTSSNGGGGGSAGGLTTTTTGTTHTSATDSSVTSEVQTAYDRAFALHITTLPKSQAGLDLPSLRAHIAKMMVEYVKNILKKVPDTTKSCSFTDITKQTPELQGYITEACQLGLMGQGITAFRPNDSLTRAEFVTLLARALYGDTYNDSAPYYAKSMAKLFADKIIKDTNPKLIEIKAYILLMLMRSATGK